MNKLSPTFSVTTQIQPHEVAALAEQGVTLIICNRPDNEDRGQPTFAEIAAAAKAAGIEARHIPIRPGMAGAAEVNTFRKAVKGAKGPVVAFCRSGARSASLWNAIR